LGAKAKRICLLGGSGLVMHAHAALVTELYEGLRALDAERMAACYHPDVVFQDPVFPELRGAEVGDMWRMLLRQARDFELTYRDIVVNETEGSAHLEPSYSFSRKRRVDNVIEARFRFQDGLIIHQEDSFDLWRWSRMALGVPGVVFGWTPLLKRQVRRQAAARLARFRAKRA
jgi:hypothetical protein